MIRSTDKSLRPLRDSEYLQQPTRWLVLSSLYSNVLPLSPSSLIGASLSDPHSSYFYSNPVSKVRRRFNVFVDLSRTYLREVDIIRRRCATGVDNALSYIRDPTVKYSLIDVTPGPHPQLPQSVSPSFVQDPDGVISHINTVLTNRKTEGQSCLRILGLSCRSVPRLGHQGELYVVSTAFLSAMVVKPILS